MLQPCRLASPAVFAITQGALLACLPIVLAWDKDGHEAIGMTTMSALQNGPTAQVKRLMGGKDAVDVAAWAHKVNKKYHWTVDLHFQRQHEGKCKPVDLSHCPDNRCLIQALKHFYGRLVNQEAPKIDWGADAKGAGVKLTDADCLKYLITLMGDLHQPLHLGFEENDMGKNLTVEFRGQKMSLYHLWDKELAQAVMKDSPGFWWGGWTHVQRTRSEYEMDNERWKKDGVQMFTEWACESLKFACEDVYRNPVSGRQLSEEAHDNGGVARVDDQLFEAWKREMLSKMLVAGARTAIVVNSILQQREAEHLQGGSGVKEIDGEEEEHAKAAAVARRNGHKHTPGHKHMEGPTAFALNVGLFGSVLVVFIYTMRTWEGDAIIEQTTKAKLQGSGKKI
jgi:hypothetical protein